MTKPLHILLSAVEPSGDRLAAKLIQELRKHKPVIAKGITGPKMREANIQTITQMESLTAMGLVEVLSKLPALYSAKKQLLQHMDQTIDCCIGVDAPDFHLPILAQAKKKRIPAVGYVSPQIWAWRPNRASKIAKKVDTLLCLFDFEPPLYPSSCHATWVGHPIIEDIPNRSTPIKDKFGLLPGSREQEIKKHLPIFLKTAECIRNNNSNAQFVLCCPKYLQLPTLPSYIQTKHTGIEAMHDVQAALTKSGTITLELALLKIPMVVAHQVNPITYFLGKQLVTGIQHISLPNILSKKQVVPEFIQNLDPKILAEQLQSVQEQTIDLSSIQKPNPIHQATMAILNTISQKSTNE